MTETATGPTLEGRKVRRRPKARDNKNGTRQRLRMFYFTLATLWGFLVGVGAALGALAASGGSIPGRRTLLVISLAAGAVLALVGGLVSSAAYREASRRHR